MDARAAKQFLISKVIEEASLENVPLSEIEKKMLQFTETEPSIPDIYEVNTQFEREYDNNEYEAKVTALLKNARERDRKASPLSEQQWVDALESLKGEDHYLLVMVGQAFGWKAATPASTRFWICLAIGIGVLLAVLTRFFLR